MLSKENADKGLVVVSVSMDQLDSKDSALEFLKEKQAASLTNLISKDGDGEAVFESFGIPSGGLPFYQLYDRTGKIRYRFTSFPDEVPDGQSFEQLDERVQQLLAESNDT